MADATGADAQIRSKDALALRIVSAAVLAPVAIATSWAGGPIFAGLVAFLCVLMAFEWSRMIERAELTPLFFVLAAGATGALILAAGGNYRAAYAAALVAGLGALGFSKRGVRLWAAGGAAYFIAPSVALIWLREEAVDGRGLVLLLFAIVWSADTGGYVGGRLVGGPKLAPTISPAKTWAGAIGGLLAGAVATGLAAPALLGDVAGPGHLAVGAGLGLASIVGDIAESGFKRRFGIKDMSGFIPGHGGVLDRLDGMIFVTAAVTAVLYGHSLVAGLEGQG